MELCWTEKSYRDLMRLYDFLAQTNKKAAINAVKSLSHAAERLLVHPRLGEKLDAFLPREVRKMVVGHYEIRYEIQHSTLYLLRIWHVRQER